MSGMMKVALPVIATVAAAYFTGGTSLIAEAGAETATVAATDAVATAGAETAAEVGASGLSQVASTSWLGNTIAAVGTYAKPLALGATVLGGGLQAYGANEAGRAAAGEADFQSKQLAANANEQQASAERKMAEQNTITAYALSNAQAAAAGSGAGATDPTVTNVMQTIAGQGRYRALTDMYNGDSSAQAMRTQAAAGRESGSRAARAGNTKMYSTILGTAGTLYDKYGDTDEYV